MLDVGGSWREVKVRGSELIGGRNGVEGVGEI